MRFAAMGRVLAWALGSSIAAVAMAQPAPATKERAPVRAATKPAAAAAVPKPAAAAAPAPAAAAAREGKGWRVGPVPAWVVAPPVAAEGVARAPDAGSRREQLVDMQFNYALPSPQFFIRIRAVALDASALGSVSQPQIYFNPAFQKVVIHGAAVIRNGQRSERLAEARIEPMRREQRLEQQVLDGGETLLVVVNDVRVGEPVEVSYTIEGDNPLFEGKVGGGMQLAYEVPVELLHHRVTVAASRPLQARPLLTDLQPERSVEGPNQVLHLVRHQVPAQPSEPATPPWVKQVPSIDLSEWRNWGEVDAWAQRLFATPTPTPPAVAERAAAFRATGLTGAALVSEVLRFVQDEVRYLSVAIGDSSHRPKPPQQTLAELNGDCKDKTVLLNTLLRELGFDAKPALVSLRRQRGIGQHLPAHDLFDHVITRLQLDGRTWWLDATVNGQGLTLASRGQWPYGLALVIGAGQELTPVPELDATLDRIEHEQRWDLSQPGAPARLVTTMRAHAFAAERWRAAVAGAGRDRLAEALAGGMARVLPGMKPDGALEVKDDRSANVLEFRQAFRHAEFGQYQRGTLEAEFVAVELLDVLVGPQEARRRYAYLIDQPRVVDHRIVVQAALPFTLRPSAPAEVSDRHFRYTARVEVEGKTLTFVRRYERRSDQVAAHDLDAWREKVLQARQQSFGRLRLPLFDLQATVPDLERIERRVRGERHWRNDQLGSILLRNEFARHVDGKVADAVQAGSPLQAHVLAQRAQAMNHLGEGAAALVSADKALAINPTHEAALEARAVALFGLGRAEEALATFDKTPNSPRAAATLSWMGSIQLHLGRAAEAEKLLKGAVDNAGGDEREFALIWLYLAAEENGRRGKEAVAAQVDGVDAKKLTGAILRYFTGAIDREALLKLAREKPEMERLNLAEAHYFIGRRHAAQGDAEEALRWYRRAVETQAVPYREVTFARLALERAGR